MEIHKDMLICDLIEMDEHIVKVLIKHGMNCSGCPGSTTETLEEAVNGHGASLEEIMKDIRNYFQEKA